jgi:tetratricopeptide (TPR) repeat protein
LAALGKTEQAQDESKAFLTGLGKLPSNASFGALNSVVNVARVQENLLAGMIGRSREESDEPGEALEGFQHAVAAEDALNYDEPPTWFPPVRPILGRVLLEMKRPAEAEKVFRAALEKLPRYPLSLAGLRDSLKAQNRAYEVEQVEQQLREGETDAVSAGRAHR